MRIFFPVEDASIDHEAGALVPYRQGFACVHALRAPLVLRDGVWREPDALSDGSKACHPTARPACAPDRR